MTCFVQSILDTLPVHFDTCPPSNNQLISLHLMPKLLNFGWIKKLMKMVIFSGKVGINGCVFVNEVGGHGTVESHQNQCFGVCYWGCHCFFCCHQPWWWNIFDVLGGCLWTNQRWFLKIWSISGAHHEELFTYQFLFSKLYLLFCNINSNFYCHNL